MNRVGVIILLVMVLCVGVRASWIRDGVRAEPRAEMSPTNIVGSGAAAGAVVSNDVIYLDVPDLAGRVAGLEAEDGGLWASLNENRDNIYLVEFRRMAGDSAALGEMIGGVVDVFEDTSGVDGAASSNATFGASGYGFVAYVPAVEVVEFTDSLVARWKLDENAGDAVVMDDVGNVAGALKQGNGSDCAPGVDTNTADCHVADGGHSCLRFGNDDSWVWNITQTYVDTSNLFSSVIATNFTIMAWVRPGEIWVNKPMCWYTVFSNERCGSSPFGGFSVVVLGGSGFGEGAGGFLWSVSGSGTYRYTYQWGAGFDAAVWTNASDRSWHHVALTWSQDDQALQLFVDGVSYTKDGVHSVAGSGCGPSYSDRNLLIGLSPDWEFGQVLPFSGEIDTVQMFGRVLTVEEIGLAMAQSIPALGGAMNLQSLPQYASSVPSEARGMVLLDTSNSVNTDVFLDLSGDLVTWDRLALADLGPYSGSIRIYGATTNLTGAGTGMVYRVQSTTNASGTVRGAAIMWR